MRGIPIKSPGNGFFQYIENIRWQEPLSEFRVSDRIFGKNAFPAVTI